MNIMEESYIFEKENSMLITNSKEWISLLDLLDYEEVDSLYKSVQNVSDYGIYRTVKAKEEGRYIVTASFLDYGLLLMSEDDRKAFLRFIEKQFCDGEDEDGWYNYKRAISKED